jgi:signal peptidase I
VDVDKAAYRNAYPARWDAVILRFPDEPKWEQASRIVGLPGETIGFTNGQMTVNGKPMSPPAHLSYLRYASPIPGVPIDKHTRHPYLIPANSYYVLGDNPAGAKDSRLRGAIPRSGIVGKIVEQPGSNKGGSANGSQPVQFLTNSTLLPAGSGR